MTTTFMEPGTDETFGFQFWTETSGNVTSSSTTPHTGLRSILGDTGAGSSAWYVKKKEWNGDLMFREFPSHDDEPFQATIRGAIFGKQMQEAQEQGRVRRVPYDPALPVDTWWDIGRRDHNAIWFVQGA